MLRKPGPGGSFHYIHHRADTERKPEQDARDRLAEGLLGACNCAISDLQADGVTEPVIRILHGLLEVDTRLR